MLIKLFASFRLKGASDRITVQMEPGSTVRDALEALFAQVPPLREHVMDPSGEALLPHVQVMLKGRLVRDLQGLDTPVTNEDTLALFPPVAGG